MALLLSDSGEIERELLLVPIKEAVSTMADGLQELLLLLEKQNLLFIDYVKNV